MHRKEEGSCVWEVFHLFDGMYVGVSLGARIASGHFASRFRRHIADIITSPFLIQTFCQMLPRSVVCQSKVFAYAWLLFIVELNSPGLVDIWEAPRGVFMSHQKFVTKGNARKLRNDIQISFDGKMPYELSQTLKRNISFIVV